MPESILKRSSFEPADRHRETALHHANAIQYRKNVEADILSSIETLIDFPTALEAAIDLPDQNDVEYMIKALQEFQPSDFDDLVEERNINDRCGYILCSQPNHREHTNAKYRLLRGKGKGSNALRVVETASLEKWCSHECSRRAIYIRAQLNTEPAWSRVSITAIPIKLLPVSTLVEKTAICHDTIRNQDPAASPLETDLTKAMKALALERGDTISDTTKPTFIDSMARLQIQEHMDTSVPSTEFKNDDAIEGYSTRFVP